MTKTEMWNHELTHKIAGNGFIAIEDVGDDYIRVFSTASKFTPPWRQAFLAWKKLLSISVYKIGNEGQKETVPRKIAPEMLEQVEELRRKISDGSVKFTESWMQTT